MRWKPNWFEAALAAVLLGGVLFAAFSDAYNLPNRWFIRDDAYYYYKVAQNIAEGHGSTFDGIHMTNGYHPLWLLVLIPVFSLASFDIILPLRILAVLLGVLQVATAILLYRLVRRAISEPAAILAACFWCFSTYILVFLYKTGVESGITVFLVVLLLSALQRFELSWRRTEPSLVHIAGLGTLSILVAFGRLDLIFFALIVGAWIILRGVPLRYLLPLDVLALIVSVVVAFIARLGFRAYFDVTESAIIMLIASLALKLPIFYFLGLYRRPFDESPLHQVVRLAIGAAIGSSALAAILLGGSRLGILPVFSRAVLLLDAALTFAFILVIRAGARILRASRAPVSVRTPMEELRAFGTRWLREGAVFYGVVGGFMAIYMVWNRLAFGTFTPVSGQIKQWWATFTHSIYGTAASSWLTFFAVNPYSEFNAWAPPLTAISDWTNQLLYAEGTGFGNPRWRANFQVVLLLVAICLLMIPLLRRRATVRAVVQTGMIPLFVGSWLQVLAYNVPGYASAKEWYWLIQPVLLVLLGAVLLRIVGDVLIRRWGGARWVVWAFVAWYGLNGAYGYWRDAYALNPYGVHPADTEYSVIIPFLKEHTEPGALIGMTGGGNIGYLMPSRTIVNMDGLINSFEYFEALKSGNGADYLYATGLRLVFANPTLLEANPYRGQFSGRIERVVEWGGKDLLRLLPRPDA